VGQCSKVTIINHISKKMSCSEIPFSLRTSAYFWAFLHLFLALAFLLASAVESFQFYDQVRPAQFEEKETFVYASTLIVGRNADVFILWCYGLLYCCCGVMIFHGIHKELTTLVNCVLVVYMILGVCAIGFMKRLVNQRLYEYPSHFATFPQTYFEVWKGNLILFLLSVQVVLTLPQVANLLLYTYILRNTKAIVQHSQCSC